ncbi:MAG: DUF3048 domain-containing protein [Parcubacteria group bacterium]|nr:DUF3048 domain-containing protein [Parcubacteria group bacterium]
MSFLIPKQTLRTALAIGAVFFALAIVGGVTALLFGFKPSHALPSPKPVGSIRPSSSPLLSPSPHASASATPSVSRYEEGALIGVMIDNHPDARPQFGLVEAEIVYEALVEGGTTRLLAIYEQNRADSIGPVRSVRKYFLEWFSGHGRGVVSHVGGSFDAKELLPTLSLFDSGNEDRRYYSRSQDAASPHDVFTSTDNLRALITERAWQTEEWSNLAFKEETPGALDRESERILTFDFSSPPFQVRYTYDPMSNSWQRSQGGEVIKDALTNEPIMVKNVVLMMVGGRVMPENNLLLTMDTIGRGKARFYIDGKEIRGSWQKLGISDPLYFLNESGAPITMNRGNLWIEVIPTELESSIEFSSTSLPPFPPEADPP